MAPSLHTAGSHDGISLTVYRGDGAALLAFDLEEHLTPDLAGFAVRCTPPHGTPSYLLNRLNFSREVTATTRPEEREWTPSDQAPFQKFRWTHFPSHVVPGRYRYEVSAMYFTGGSGLKQGPTVDVSIELTAPVPERFDIGFTRGYLSSQAYAEEFHNAEIRPGRKSLDYDTGPYRKQYEWLGFHAREMVFRFLDECLRDPGVSVDVFAFDLDEPDFVRGLEALGSRLRILLDNAPVHTKPSALEPVARARLEKSAGAHNVKVGHFHRFAHDKVMIQKRAGKAVKVLTGSANFSIRGLYVQANNVLIFADAATAAYYETAFTEAFTNMAGFEAAPIAKRWFDVREPGVPPVSVSFSPHTSASVSLSRVAEAIRGARSSVLYAVMELGGGGLVLQDLRRVGLRKAIFSYGVTQSATGVKLYKPGESTGILVSFAYLHGQVPAPFRSEWSGGMGQVIHHKFVVVDFTEATPVVFAGSSNLSSGGEEKNGDNLLAITDRVVATKYAVEAIRLVDHYHFRVVTHRATTAHPLVLRSGDAAEKWWAPYYDKKNIKYRERVLFSR
jgi:phosphatidylserine/phosphatidylglycerophosphate/cardiolipin synthase-like enzyme